MERGNRFKELRKILYKEIQGELGYQDKKEFLKECIDDRVIARVHDKYLRRRRFLTVTVVIYGIYLMLLFIYLLIRIEDHLAITLIAIAMALLPLFILLYFSKVVMGYRKMDLALRLITKFYVKKKMDT